MEQLIKRAFDAGVAQALQDMGVGGVDLDALLQDTQQAAYNAGAYSGDANAVALSATGAGADSAYDTVRAVLGQ